MTAFRRLLPAALALCLAAWGGGATAQEAQQQEAFDDGVPTAPVVVDGATLMRLRGAGVYPAERRAAAVAGRIVDAAEERSFEPADLRIDEADQESRIMAGSTPIVRLFDADGAVEAVDRRTLAKVALEIIRKAIVAYR